MIPHSNPLIDEIQAIFGGQTEDGIIKTLTIGCQPIDIIVYSYDLGGPSCYLVQNITTFQEGTIHRRINISFYLLSSHNILILN